MITIKDVEHVAKLARLELTEEEKEKFTHQLGDVLAHVEKMNEAAKYLVGEHDFKSICSVKTQAETTVRKLYFAEVFKDKEKKFARQFRVNAEYIKGEQPNELVSLESSLDVMRLMDEIRRQIGVIFPCD